MKAFLPKISFRFFNLEDPAKVRLLIAGAVLGCVFLFYHFNIFERFELVTYDYRFAAKGSRSADPKIVVIEISDDSVAKIGRWPWDRDWHATLIQALKKMGARSVVFDVLFSETSIPAKDAVLAQAIDNAGNVYLAQVLDYSATRNAGTVLESLPEFTKGAKGQGHINLQPDKDGVMRRIPILVGDPKNPTPQLSLDVALDEWGVKKESLKVAGHSLHIPLPNGKNISIPLDAKNNLIINWVGKWKESFKHFSYIDVIGSYALIAKGQPPSIPLENFKDKICFVGTTAAGLFDIRPTPLEPSYPAVGVNLTVLDNLLQNRFIRKLPYWADLLILLAIFAVMSQIMRTKNFFRAAVWTSCFVSGYIIFSTLLFIFFDIWINIVYPLMLIVLTHFFVTIYNQLSVAIERSKLLKLATRDSLTGLYNIGHFKLLLKAEIATIAIRRDKKLSLVIGDVDNFKSTNDTYGHVTGDSVLKEVAIAFKNNCRALDVAARYGGEEFVVMLPGANVDEAFKVADKIRMGVAEKVFFHPKGDFKTSVSIGVTRISPDDKDIEAVVARADRALYEAKHTGKNKVAIAVDSPLVDGS